MTDNSKKQSSAKKKTVGKMAAKIADRDKLKITQARMEQKIETRKREKRTKK